MAYSRVSRDALTVEHVRERLDYDPLSGFFRWKSDLGPGRPDAGDIAGTTDSEGYICIKIFGYSYKAHRLAWFVTHEVWPHLPIDHRDLDKINNAISNLRLSTNSQNQYNIKLNKKVNKSGFKGVYWYTRDNIWVASIRVNGIPYHLGCYKNIDDAASAYAKAATERHGEFARIS